MLILDVEGAPAGFFRIHPRGNEGWDVKDVINELPSTKYKRRFKCYEVSWTDYDILLDLLMVRGLISLVRTTNEFKEKLDLYRRWVEYLLALRKQVETEFDVETTLPLYNHQRTGAQFLIKRRYAVLADEMGVGKSPTSAAAAWHLIQHGKAKNALIVCPASVKMQWAEDTIKTFLPNATYTVIGTKDYKPEIPCPKAGGFVKAKSKGETVERRVLRGHVFDPRRSPCKGCLRSEQCKELRGDNKKPFEIRREQYKEGTHFTIVNYELLRADALGKKKPAGGRQPSMLGKLGVKFDIVIADESHRLRNANIDTFDAVWRVAHDAKYRWALTGTPLQTKLEDAWGIMRFVNPAVFGTSRYRFLNRYAQRDHWGKIEGYIRVQEVHEKMAPNMMRRRKDDVLDLPDFLYAQHYIDLNTQEHGLYKNIKNQQVTKAQIPNDELRESLNTCDPIVTVTRCRQAALSPYLIDPEKYEFEKSTKVRDIMAVLDDIADDHKIIIFCEYTSFLHPLSALLKKKGIGHVYLHGGVPAGPKRQSLVERFRKDDYCRVFMTTTAGGEGLNLQVADVLMLVNLTWNPSMVAQIKGRLHRIGQTKHVNVISFLAKDTVEIKVFQDGRYREAISDIVVDGREIPQEPPIRLEEMIGLL